MSLRELFTGPKVDRTLRDLEESLTDPAVRSSRLRIEALLHPDFTETSSSGDIYDRASMIEMMTSETPGEVLIRDFSTSMLSRDVALNSYRTVGASGQEARRTSLWVETDQGWMLRHHQGTRVADRWARVT